MIFIDRSKVPVPEVLRSQRANDARERIAKLLTEGTDKHLEQLRISFDSSLWSSVIPDLMTLFNGKCAYCESTLSTRQPVDIEHYRPKQGAEDLKNERQHLHYCWLAYEWDNLLIACAECNRRRTIGGKLVGKAQLFPVESARAGYMASVAECRKTELPLLLDPCFDDPADHLLFEESGQVKAKTPRGAATIDILGLNLRTLLVTERRQAWLETEHAFNQVRAISLSPSKVREALDGALSQAQKLLSPQLSHVAARNAAYEQFRQQLSSRSAGVDPGVGALTAKESPPQASSSPVKPTSAVPAGNAAANAPRHAAAAPPSAASAPPTKIADRRTLPPFAFQRLRRIEIRNFKAIEALDLDVPLGPSGEENIPGALMMLGENATGKSSVLDAVALALLGTEQIAELNLPGRDLLRRESRGGIEAPPKFPAHIRLQFDEAAAQVELGIGLDGTFTGNRHRAVVLLGYGPRRFFASGTEHAGSPAARVKSMFDPLATLANPQKWLLECSDAHFALAVRALRPMLLLPDEAVVERWPLDAPKKTHVIFELEGRKESLDRLSEGYKTIVAMGVDITREMLEYWTDLESAHGIVLIDELDTHLHPRWKMRIGQRLRRAFPDVQFIASTHDPLCLRGYHDGEVQVLRRDAEGRIERVIDLPSVRGLSVQQLLTSEYFGLFSAEDPALEDSVARYVTLAAKRDRTPQEDAELARQRVETDERIQLGATPDDAVLQKALKEYLLQRRAAPQTDKAQIQRATVNKLVDRWSELDAQGGTAGFASPPGAR